MARFQKKHQSSPTQFRRAANGPRGGHSNFFPVAIHACSISLSFALSYHAKGRGGLAPGRKNGHRIGNTRDGKMEPTRIQTSDERNYPSISNLIHGGDMHGAQGAVEEAFAESRPGIRGAHVSPRVWRFFRIVNYWDGMIRRARNDVSRSDRKKLIAEKLRSYGINALIDMTGDYFELDMFLANTDFVFKGVGKATVLNQRKRSKRLSPAHREILAGRIT